MLSSNGRKEENEEEAGVGSRDGMTNSWMPLLDRGDESRTWTRKGILIRKIWEDGVNVVIESGVGLRDVEGRRYHLRRTRFCRPTSQAVASVDGTGEKKIDAPVVIDGDRE